MSIRTAVVKRLIAMAMAGWSSGSIAAQRARQEKQTKYLRLPAGIRYQTVNVEGVPAEWISTPEADVGTLIYLHGGAYALGSTNTLRELVARLAHTAHRRMLSVDYRLAPEHPHPAALEDVCTVYRWLLNQVDPSQIIIAGDSAGGGLAIATLVALRNAGEPQPAGAVSLSPWTDLALTGTSIQSKAKRDPILDSESLAMYAQYYAKDHELTHPLISPLYADLSGLPPLLIQVGSDEILLDDAVRITEHARSAGVEVTLQIWDEMFHVFQMFAPLPETKEAVAKIAEFVSQRITPSPKVETKSQSYASP